MVVLAVTPFILLLHSATPSTISLNKRRSLFIFIDTAPSSPPSSSCNTYSYKCDSSIAGDCCTSRDTSEEKRRCTDGYTPIYTGVGCAFEGNEFTCYHPSCNDLPADNCGPNDCHDSSKASAIVGIVVLIVLVLGVVGGTGGGIACCYFGKCCCWSHRRTQVGVQSTATAVATPAVVQVQPNQQAAATPVVATAVAVPCAQTSTVPVQATAVAVHTPQPFAG